MRVPPRQEGETTVHLRSALSALVLSLVPAGLLLAAAAIAHNSPAAAKLGEPESGAYVRTAGFVTFLMMISALAHSARSDQTGILRLGIFSNRKYWFFSGAVLLFSLIAVYLPFLRPLFDTRALSFGQWLIALAFGAVTLVWGEVFKGLIRPLFDKVIKVAPKTNARRTRRVDFGEGFFSKFENADPTQEEEIRESGEEEMEIVEVSDREQNVPEPQPEIRL